MIELLKTILFSVMVVCMLDIIDNVIRNFQYIYYCLLAEVLLWDCYMWLLIYRFEYNMFDLCFYCLSMIIHTIRVNTLIQVYIEIDEEERNQSTQ